MTADDFDAVLAVREEAFNMPATFRDRARDWAPDIQRVYEENGRILAAAAVMDFGHFFGGRSVPAAGISGVAVAPHARGRRLAEELVGAMLAEWRERAPLSSLYPATVPLYRRLGYEYAAYRTRYRVGIRDLPRFTDAGDVEPWTDDDLDDVAEAQRAAAASGNGTVDRPAWWWPKRTLREIDGRVYRYLVREGGRVTGSVVYSQEKPFHYEIECRDLFWTTPHAARALLTFFARHASLGTTLSWVGSPFDPLTLFVPQDTVRRDGAGEIQYPMYRVLDVPAAMGMRGFDAPDAAVTVEIDDALIPANRGPWRLEIAGGKGSAEPSGSAAVRLGPGAFAAVYTGFLSPADARRAGVLDGSDDAVAALTAMFAGPAPWLADFF